VGIISVVLPAMADFTLRINATEGRLLFTFTRIYTVNGTIYFTTVFGSPGRHFLHMENRDGTWKIVQSPQPPGWVLVHEEELGKFLDESLKT
jgi:hypothetical protein